MDRVEETREQEDPWKEAPQEAEGPKAQTASYAAR